MASVSVIPSGKALAADVQGVDLSRPLDDATLAAILEAWSQHLVLRFRRQRLSDEQLERFSARLGALDRAPNYSVGTEVRVRSEIVA